MSSPAVSVLLAVRNGERHLGEALESLLAQSMSDFELIVVDDGSTDRSGAILAETAARDRRLRILRNDTNAGLPTALNRGLATAQAPLVARADADDVYRSDRLARQLAHMQANPQIGVLSSGYNRIDEHGARRDTKRPLVGPERLRFRMLFQNPLLHSGVMFRADLVRAAGGYDPAYWTAQDSDLWARLSGVTRLDNIPEPLVDYRVHDTSTMRTRGDEGRRLSLTVPERLQSAYLGRPASDVEATVETYQSFGYVDQDKLRRGIAGLRGIHAKARRSESTALMREFTSDVAASLERQAGWHASGSKRFAVRLAATAMMWRLHAMRAKAAASPTPQSAR